MVKDTSTTISTVLSPVCCSLKSVAGQEGKIGLKSIVRVETFLSLQSPGMSECKV